MFGTGGNMDLSDIDRCEKCHYLRMLVEVDGKRICLDCKAGKKK